MSINAGITAIRDAMPYRVGKLSDRILVALLDELKACLAFADIPEPKLGIRTASTSTAGVIFSGACRLYALIVNSPASGSTLNVIARATDGATIARGSVECATGGCGIVVFQAAADGTPGIAFGTDLRVLAVAAADGSANPAAGDRPTITAIYGV